MVLGMDAIVRICVKLFAGERCEDRAAVRRVVEDSNDVERREVRAANMRLCVCVCVCKWFLKLAPFGKVVI